MKKLLSSILMIAALALPVCAQTNAPANGPTLTQQATTAGNFVSQWLRDNTNFFDEKTVIVEAGALYSKGKRTDETGDKRDVFGGMVDVRFPLDAQGQASIGLLGAYFDTHFFAGSINVTLGKTVHVPVINQDVFLWVEGGPALNLSQPDRVLAQAFTGIVWKHDVGKNWTAFVNAGIGTVTDWDGKVGLLSIGAGKKF